MAEYPHSAELLQTETKYIWNCAFLWLDIDPTLDMKFYIAVFDTILGRVALVVLLALLQTGERVRISDTLASSRSIATNVNSQWRKVLTVNVFVYNIILRKYIVTDQGPCLDPTASFRRDCAHWINQYLNLVHNYWALSSRNSAYALFVDPLFPRSKAA